MIVKMNILRLLDSSDDKEKISVARPEGPPLLCPETSSVQRTRIEETVKESKSKRSKRRQFAITG